ncbi:benzaldehyde dehydrogenase [Variovorax sp. J22R24]|uniref:benzaldehyde dehydrogenase n=1 Tax=Variovorax gracilis TaxID=3053502 RepID=UPI0025768AAC|nr:benzaldehyde dehydrogenase [Variovorax sp. J22R24]MDM0106595.1 benzaldehyde dehydrogenase [Variovorax sp. J22R24]
METAQHTTSAAKSAWLDESNWRDAIFNGRWERVGQPTDVFSPATGEAIGRIALVGAAEVSRSAATARDAQRAWHQLDFEQRARILRKAADLAEAHLPELADWIVRESGSVRAKAEFEMGITIRSLREAAAMPSQPQGLVLPGSSDRISLCRRLPLGVIGVIAPFNFPLYLAMRAVAPALAVGNAVVLKPDPRTTISGGVVIAQLLAEAGLPEGVLHVLPGGGDAGAALCSDPNIAMIAFTGSTAAGRKVGELAGRHLKKVSLELGGKNSLIVLDDADMDLAVSNAAWGAYLHQGQICMATGRILVQRGIAEEFTRRLAEKASNLPVGDPSTNQVALGPLINRTQIAHAQDIVDRSVSAGAKLEAGGTHEGLFFKATVLSGVCPGMPAFEEEVFGPVAPITTFETDEEAITLANQTEYGLSAGVISRSVSRAFSLGNRLRTGLLHINDQTVADDVVNPFGGVGASGNGTSIGGPANWEEFTQWQWVTVRGTAQAYPF